jgi:23S rRNA pseudouridine1911/1915/1917 synthase
VISIPIREVWHADLSHVGSRLDRFLEAHTEAEISRSQMTRAITRGDVCVNGEPKRKAGYKVRLGDVVMADIAATEVPDLLPEDIPLELLHVDDDVIVVHKPAGLVVHPGAGHPSGTLVNGLLHLMSLPDGGHLRPGIVHRLDKDTSGVMVVARSSRGLMALAEQFSAHTTQRTYEALVLGKHLPDEGTFDSLHGRHPKDRKKFSGRVDRGRRAITHFKVVERLPRAVRVECRLETGRTHQIRVHLAEAQAPLLGDRMYGGRRGQSKLIDRQALHARTLGFVHPDGRSLLFTADPPEDFTTALHALRSGKEP